MKIGFDAKRAFCNTTGLGNYSRTLIASLEKCYPDNEYLLYSTKETNLFQTDSKIITPSTYLTKIFKSYWRSNLSNYIDDEDIDLFHGLSHEIPKNIFKKVKTIVTIHDLIFLSRPKEFKFIDRKIYEKKFRYACENSHGIVAITNETKNDIQKYFKISEEKIKVIYQSCDKVFQQLYDSDQKQNFIKKYSLPQHFLLYVGSMVPRKKPYELAKAYLAIASKLDLPLIMLGRGPEKEKIQKLIVSEKLEGKILFFDVSSKEELALLYQCASLFIYPSVYEGFGIPIIEAQFSKTPVLTSTFSCLPEVAGPDAFFVNPDNQEEFSQKILELVHDSELLRNSCEKNFNWVQQFRQEQIAKDYSDFYSKILEI